jgi:hypothetical protein
MRLFSIVVVESMHRRRIVALLYFLIGRNSCVSSVMKYVAVPFVLGLLIYSGCLLTLDFAHGQLAVRGYFSDIVTGADYPVLYKTLFGINTSLSVCLLYGCGLLHLTCTALVSRQSKGCKFTFFLWSQVTFFAYVAADERLRIHEWLGAALGMEDAWILLLMGGLEVFLLVFVGDVLKQARRTKIYLLLTVLFFALMVFVDGFIQPDRPGRLAVEDLLKLWAVVFMFGYAWCYTINYLTASDLEGIGSD